MRTVALGDLVAIQTGKLDANASSPDGEYPFFTCAHEPLRIANWKYDLDAILIAGNGDLNVKHYKGKFDAYQRTYILSSKTDRVDTRYLFHFLDKYLDRLREQSIGGIIKYIKLGMLTAVGGAEADSGDPGSGR
jgi:type I restriction enzyme, S subunit